MTDSGSPARDPAPVPPGFEEEQRNVGDPIDLRALVRLVRRRHALVAAITLLTVGAAALLELRRPPSYRAQATIRLSDPREALGGQIAGASAVTVLGRSIDPLLSQLEVLRSRAVLGEIVDRVPELRVRAAGVAVESLGALAVEPAAPPDTLRLRFTAESLFVAGARGDTAVAYGDTVAWGGVRFAVGAPPPTAAALLVVRERDAALAEVERRLRVTPRHETDVADAVYTDEDPRRAQRVAAAAVERFAAFSQRTAVAQAEQRRVFLGEQLAHGRRVLDSARGELAAFRRRTSAFSARDQLVGGQADLTALQLRRADLEAEGQVYRTLLAGLQRGRTARREQLQSLLLAPDFAANPVVAQLTTQLAGYEATRDSLTSGPWARAATHPDVRRLDTLIARTEGKLVGAVRGKLTMIDARVASLDALRERSARSLQGLSGREAEEAELIAEVDAAGRLVNELGAEYHRAELEAALKAGFVEILDLPALPVDPVGTAPAFRLGLAALLGLLLAVATAVLVEHLTRPISRPQEIEAALRIPGLVVIPRLARPRRAGVLRRAPEAPPQLRPVAIADPGSAEAEAFRGLRTKIVFARPDGELRSFAVTSPSPGDGKTTIAANLAAAYAHQGRVVLLIDGDLHRPSQHRVFDVPREPGLVELVRQRTDLTHAIHRTGVQHLWCLPAGKPAPDASDVLGHPRFGELVAELRSQFDVVIVDSPPVLATADPLLISRHTGGVLLVMHAGLTTTEMAQAALRHLADVHAEVVGAVLNDPDDRVHADGEYYGYYHHYARLAAEPTR